MINRLPPFEALRDESLRERFDRELLRYLAEWDYTIVSVCLDKQKHKDTYQTWRYDPYHYCLAILLERFVFFLNKAKAKGTSWLSQGAARKTDVPKTPLKGCGSKARITSAPRSFRGR